MGNTGAPLNLTWPAEGTDGWDSSDVNPNFVKINTAIAALQAGGSTGLKGDKGDTGSPGIVWAGPWGSGVAYVAGNATYFNGSSYLSLAPNVGVQPDTHPSTWAVLALAGSLGPQGLQGIQGIPGTGGGTTVTFPITIEEGGTEADNADEARQNLSAAGNGQNTDINALFDILCGSTPDPTTTGITIRSIGGGGTALSVGNGTDFGGFSSDAGCFAKYINCAGTVICGGLVSSGLLQTNSIGDATPGAGINVADLLRALGALLVQGAAPSVSAGQVGLGGNTASTASAGGGSTVPGTVLTWWLGNFGGAIGKVPVFAP